MMYYRYHAFTDVYTKPLSEVLSKVTLKSLVTQAKDRMLAIP